MFAMDVFSENSGLELLVALFMHLIPSIILIILLVVAWKFERIGGYLFLLIALAFMIFFGAYHELFGFLILVVPLLLVGILFLVNSRITSSKDKKSTK